MKLPPINSVNSKETENFILFNRDRSAIINLYGYCNTNYVRNNKGTMVIVRGAPDPNLTGGWSILGQDYKEIWTNSEKLKIYNRVFPPDSTSGEPLPFGAFAGIDLKTNKASPTTRCADCLSINIKDYKERYKN